MRKIETILKLEQLMNPPNLVAKKDSKIVQDKILYRRKRINQLRLRGLTDEKIARRIGCGVSTVEKDLHLTRQNYRKWFDEEIKTDFCQAVSDVITFYDNAIEDLLILYSEAIEIDEKLRVLNTISEYEIKKINIFRETPVVQNYLRRNSK